MRPHVGNLMLLVSSLRVENNAAVIVVLEGLATVINSHDTAHIKMYLEKLCEAQAQKLAHIITVCR